MLKHAIEMQKYKTICIMFLIKAFKNLLLFCKLAREIIAFKEAFVYNESYD